MGFSRIPHLTLVHTRAVLFLKRPRQNSARTLIIVIIIIILLSACSTSRPPARDSASKLISQGRRIFTLVPAAAARSPLPRRPRERYQSVKRFVRKLGKKPLSLCGGGGGFPMTDQWRNARG